MNIRFVLRKSNRSESQTLRNYQCIEKKRLKIGNRIGNFCYDIKAIQMKSKKMYLLDFHLFNKKRVSNDTLFVGVAGFEPATSASQTRRDNRATLHPDNECISTSVENKKTTGTKFLCLYYVSAISRRLLRRDRDSNPGYLFLGTTI